MAYRGPTFLPTAEVVQMQQRRFDAAAARVPLPSEPLRVETESARLDEALKGVRLPSEDLRVAHEQDRFDRLTAGAPTPSRDLAETFPPPAPADSSQPVPSAPDETTASSGGPAADAPPAPEAPALSQDAVQATIAYLSKLRGGMKDAGLSEPDRQTPDQPPMPPAALFNTPGGPTPGRFPVAPVPPKPVPPSEEEQARVLQGEPFTPETLTSELGKFVNAQGGQMQPAAGPLDALGVAGEHAVRREVAEGGASLARGGVLADGVRAAEGPAGDSYAGGDLAAFMERKRAEAMRRKNAGEVRGPGGADYSRAAEEDYYRGQAARAANEPPLWEADWAHGLEDPSTYGARPDTADWLGSHEFRALEPEAAPTTRAEVLAGLNRGDLLAQLKRLTARAPEASASVGSEPGPSLRMPGGPVPEDAAQGRYVLPGVLGDGAPPAAPPAKGGLRQRALGGDLGEDLGGIVAPRTVSVLRHVLGDQRDVIGAPANGPFGQQLAAMVHDARDDAATMRGAWLDDARDALALDKPRFANLVDVLEGTAQPVDASVARAADATRTVFDQVYARARRVLPDVKAKLDDYFPHVFDPKEFTGEGYQRAVRHLIDTGQATTIAEAGELLGRARRFSSDFRASGNLEHAREVDYPFYLKTPEALVQHLTESSRRIAEAEMFGARGELKDRIVAQIARDGGDAAAVERAFKTALEQGEPPSDLARGASRAIRGVESAAHLGLSSLSNATQLTNTAAVFGPVRTATTVRHALSADGLREAVRAGVVDPATIATLKEGSGATRVLGRVTAPGMGRVETVNRSVTYHTAVDFATEMARKAADGDERAARALTDLGLDAQSVAARGLLTDAEKVRAGRIGVERTQFYVDPQDLPGWASTPAGRVAVQFRTFGYRQSRYVGREILTPLLRGDPRPLLVYLAVGTALGVPVDTAYDVASGRGVKDDPKDVALGGLARAGGLGLAGDLYRGAKNIGTLPPEMAVARSVGLVGGPFVGSVADAIGSTAAAAQGNGTPALRTVLGHLPIAGPLLQNTIAPYKKRGQQPAQYVLPGRRSGRDSGRSGGRSSGR